jgi:hypothetical protein
VNPPLHDLGAAARTVANALAHAGGHLERLEGRRPESGLLEVRELAPALRTALGVELGSNARARVDFEHPIVDWTRRTTRVDLVGLDDTLAQVELAAELKVWDIGHQLFDLVKAACLLRTGVASAFLVCVAKTRQDFDRRPGGVLFPDRTGERRTHNVAELIDAHAEEWRHHAGRGGPEPTSAPTSVVTSAVAVDVPVRAYPGHSARAVEVSIGDPAPVPFVGGWPRRR